MATTPVATVTPVKLSEPKLEEIKVTVEAGRELAAILLVETDAVLKTAWEITRDYDGTESQFRKDAMQSGAVMFTKYLVQQHIQHWESLVNKASKMQRYADKGRPALEALLAQHPKYKAQHALYVKALVLKAALR